MSNRIHYQEDFRFSQSRIPQSRIPQSRKPLTARQRQVLGFITQCIRKRGYGPTVREIASNLGLLTANGALAHLTALEKKGYIRRKAYSSRAIQLVGHQEPTGPVVCGCLRGGVFQPFETPEPFETSNPFMSGWGKSSSKEDVFLVRVQDDTLLERHIQQGDLLVLRHAASASFNEKVLFSDKVPHTLGICKMDPISQRLFLRPLDEYEPRFLNDSRSILGVLIGVFRAEWPAEEMLV